MRPEDRVRLLHMRDAAREATGFARAIQEQEATGVDSREEVSRADGAADVERTWEDEIRRRLTQVDAGTAELIPAEDVFAELRRRRAALKDDGEAGESWETVLDQIDGQDG